MLDNLYENIGGKIKNWAKWIFIIETIGCIIAAIVVPLASYDAGEVIWASFLIMIIGPLAAWVGSWLLYAFGQLVEDVHDLKSIEERNFRSSTYRKSNDECDDLVCPVCKMTISVPKDETMVVCPKCRTRYKVE